MSWRNTDTLYPFTTDLTDGDPLPGGDEVARYCQPAEYNRELDEPAVGAFIRKRSHKGLSVNRLQSYQEQDRTGAVDRIKGEVGGYYTLRRNGRFVVFNVDQAKDAARERGFDISIIYAPILPDKPSHSLVANLPPDENDEYRVAAAIMRLITKADTYPTII